MTDTYLQIREKRSLWAGALFWVAFSLAAVALRGVRWEETYEHALAITRTVPYPEGHPFFIYCRDVFSGQSYFSALLMSLWDSPLFINGLRNVVQLSFCTVPVFMLGMRFSGRAWGGHLGVVLVLLGVHRGFQSYYPIEMWPHFFATGQIGAGYALLIFVLLLANCWRSAWFLLGLMPMIHIGQWPVIGLFAGLHWLWRLREGDRVSVRQAVGWFLVGLAPCVLFFVVHRQFHVPMPVEGAWFAEGDARAIWSAYTGRHDLHRAVPRDSFLKSLMASGLVLMLSAFVALREGGATRVRRDAAQVFGFALLLGAIVIGIWGVHQGLGSRAPFLLIGWMPYRLMNHLAILLVPLVVGILWRGRGGQGLLALVLLYALLLPLWQMIFPAALYARYAGNLESPIYVLCGGALVSALWPLRRGRPAWLARRCLGAALLLVAWYYPFALACGLAGAIAWVVCDRATWQYGSGGHRRLRNGALVLGAMLLGRLMIHEARTREQLPSQPIHQHVADWLDAHGEKDAMIVTPYWDVNWLAKTRRPIFADYQTAHLMSYVPALAPSLKKMHADVFGFIVDGETGPPLAEWPERSAEEWRRLAEVYGFRYVLAPAEMALKLERVLAGQPYDLYRVGP